MSSRTVVSFVSVDLRYEALEGPVSLDEGDLAWVKHQDLKRVVDGAKLDLQTAYGTGSSASVVKRRATRRGFPRKLCKCRQGHRC